MVLQHVGIWVKPLWRAGTDKVNNIPSRFGSILGVLDSFVLLFLLRFYSRTCKDEAIDRVGERPWEPAERIYPRCQTSTSLLHTRRTWDDCIQSFLSTLSQTKWDRESRREIRAAAEVSNNLHLICFSSSLPVLSHFCLRLLGNNVSVQTCEVWLWAPRWFGFFPMNPFLFSSPDFSFLLISFPLSLAVWRNWRDFSAREMCGAASSQEQQQPRAFIKAVLRNDHSAVGKLSWPRGQAVSGDWWEGQRGQAILVPPT